MKLFPALNTSVQHIPQPLISESVPLLFCCSLFFKEYLNPQAKINKMVNKHTSRIRFLIFTQPHQGLISPPITLLNFSKTCISHHSQGQLSSFRCLDYGKHIVTKKLNLLLMIPRRKSSPGSYHRVRETQLYAEENLLFLRKKGRGEL